MIRQTSEWCTKITDVRTCWLRVPLPRPIADSTHELKVIDLILVSVQAGDWSGVSYMLSFDYAPSLLTAEDALATLDVLFRLYQQSGKQPPPRLI